MFEPIAISFLVKKLKIFCLSTHEGQKKVMFLWNIPMWTST
jgi:hypothetical protein